MRTHESVASICKVQERSNQKFGLAFAAIFFFVTFWPLVHLRSPRWWALPIAAAFLVLALFLPAWLSLLNRAWTNLGLLLSNITKPILMAALFFGVVTPLGWFLRWKGEDLLSLRFTPEAESYWIARCPPGPAPGSMIKQF